MVGRRVCVMLIARSGVVLAVAVAVAEKNLDPGFEWSFGCAKILKQYPKSIKFKTATQLANEPITNLQLLLADFK